MTFIFFLVSISAIFLGRRTFSSFVNPISFFSLSFLIQFVAYYLFTLLTFDQLHFSTLLDGTQVHWLYSLSIIGFTLPLALSQRHTYIHRSELLFFRSTERNVALTIQFEIFFILIIIAVIIATFGFPIFQMLSGQVNIAQLNSNLIDLPFGILGFLMWLSFVTAVKFAIISNIKTFGAKTLRLSRIAVGLIIFASILYGKRQIILAVLVFYSLMLIICTPLNRKMITRIIWLTVIFVLFLAVYISVQFIRTNGSGDGSGRIFLMELPLSLVWPLINFDRLILFHSPNYKMVGLISQIIPNRLLGHNVEDVRDILFEPTASSGVLFYAYQDFGAIGVFTASFCIGGLVRFISMPWKGLIANLGTKLLCLWACLTVAFYSHIISNNYFIIPVLIFLMTNVISGTRRLR